MSLSWLHEYSSSLPFVRGIIIIQGTMLGNAFGRYFLKSPRRKSSFLYQISNDNPQKDNFHKSTFRLTEATFSDRKLIGREFFPHYYPQK
jgi:hypothetical protein